MLTERTPAPATKRVALDVPRQYLMAGRGGSPAAGYPLPSALWLGGFCPVGESPFHPRRCGGA
jgi:hypothetical protein